MSRDSDKVKQLEGLSCEVASCVRCKLHTTRKRTVFGEGSSDASVMFIGEGPGRDEDAQGRPFVGRA
ncbi:MAG TPA: uracil-DNA glycosylase family protein, partial [Spirochaetota bacterium]